MPPGLPKPPAPYDRRLQILRAALAERKVDGLLVWNRLDQYWLSGFSGEDGGLLISPRQVVLLTDGRFDETADLEAPFARKVVRKRRSPEFAAREIRRMKLGRIAFDPGHLLVDLFTQLSQLIRPARLVPVAGLVSGFRQVKDDDELARIRAAVSIAERAFLKLLTWIRPGQTEREVAARLVYDMQRLGADEPAFHPIVAAGANASLPHYEPGDHKIATGSLLLIDWGARARWYVSDLTRVIPFGTIPSELRKVFDIVRAAHDQAISAIRPGIKAGAVDRVARQIIDKSGYGKHFSHSLGHAIGLAVHESPGLRHQAADILKPGMVLTVEPGIYLPGIGGVRIEDDVLVTETGFEVLSSLPTDVRVS